MNKEIMYIEAKHIRPHPDNPRKNLGDLSELVESIKKNGVLQNLTVIPVEGEPGEYMTLIGHRRYAAGIQAGVEKFPCQIAENLTPREQVSIMLEENMQRNDLTIWEQANGFQMMLDLGETEESIAEKTGFSKTTVRRRLNIAKLNQKVLHEKEKDECFQLSLKDLYELEKIPDVKTRDKILKESTSSNNLAQKAKSVADEIQRKERERVYIKLCKIEGIKPAPKGAENEKYDGKWETVEEFDLDKEVSDKLGCKTQEAKGELFYVVWWRSFTIIKKKGKEKRQLSEYEIRQKEQDSRKRQIKAMQKEMSAERTDFIRLSIEKKFKPEGEKLDIVGERLFGLMIDCGVYMGESTMMKFLIGENTLYGKTDVEKAEYEKQRDSINFIYKLLIYSARSVEEKDIAEWNATYHKDNGKLVMRFDEILALFGFTYSKEEFYKLADGSHDLYMYKDGEANGK